MHELLDQYKPLDDYIGELADRQSKYSAGATAATNFSIYEERYVAGVPGFTALPYCMYFYYVRVNMNGKLEVSHYFYDAGQPIARDEATLRPIISVLAQNARPSTSPKNPPRDGQRFEGIEWTRKSYIAIFIDEASWKFHKFPNADPAVLFITEPKDDKVGLPNHSFFDGMDLDITMPIFNSTNTDERSTVVFMNHMKGDEQGNDIGDGVRQFFQFKMFLDVKFADGTDGMTVILDPGGTNLGPPVGPP